MRLLIAIALAALLLFRWAPPARARSVAACHPVRAHGMECARRRVQRSDQLNRADARRLSLARHPVRPASLRRSQPRALAAAGRPAPPEHQYPQSVCRQRRPSLDWHAARAGQLEGRHLDHSPGGTGQVGGMLEDREGTVWAGTRYPPPGKLCAFRKDGVQCYGEKGEFGARASSVSRIEPATSGSGRSRIVAVEARRAKRFPWTISRARAASSKRSRAGS